MTTLFFLLFILPLSAHAEVAASKTLNAKPLTVMPVAKTAPVATSSDADCATAKKRLALHSMGLRAYCSADTDCAAFQLDPSPCTRPEVFRQDAHVADDKDLAELQEKIKTACSHVWAMAGACVPYQAKPACRDAKCVDAGADGLPSPIRK